MDFRNAHLFIDLQFATGSFLPFHTVHGVLKAKILKWFAISFSSGPHSVRLLHLSELSTMTCPSWVALHNMAHSFIEYLNCEFPDIQAGFRKGRGTRDQIANIHWIIEKTREFQKNIYFCFIDYTKAFDCVDHNKLWKILQQMGIPDHMTYLLRNLCAGQEATVRTTHGTTDWFQIRKGEHQGYILSPCLFNFYAECCCYC